jgi:glycosyltransferase involved in cell wall biosynthesis
VDAEGKIVDKRKIAVITLEFPPRILGGAGVIIARVANELASRGREVHILTPGPDNRYHRTVEQDVHVHRLPAGFLPRWRVPYFWLSLQSWFAKIAESVGGFDLVHGSGIADLTLRRQFLTCPRILTVYHLASSVVKALKPSWWERVSHPGDETGLGPTWESTCIRRADRLTTISRATRSEISARFGIPPEKIRIIPMGTELGGYDFSARAISDVRAEFGAETGSLILFVGRLETRKGVADLLRAFSDLGRDRPAVLVLIGSGDRNEYVRLSESLGIADRVRFIGFVPPSSEKIRKLYAACDLVAIPSAYEGLGLVALEARAAGKFSVAYRVGGLPEVLPEGAGYLVPPRDWHAFSSAMEKALHEPHGEIPKPRSWAEVGMDFDRYYGNLFSMNRSSKPESRFRKDA